MESRYLRKQIGHSYQSQSGESKLSAIPDESLIESYNNEKDQSAFEEIFNRYIDKVNAIALRLTRDSHQSEEIL